MTEENLPDLQWFPGHMEKARRMIKQHLKLVDAVVELLDARAPESSANPVLGKIIAAKPRLIVLNKADLADPTRTKKWQAFFGAQGITAMPVDARTGRGVKEFIRAATELSRPATEKFTSGGGKARRPRLMVVGIPNVGKSSLINRLSGEKKTQTADRPGVTRNKQWISVGKYAELLDTPGVLWPKFEDRRVGLHLAFVGAIRDELFPAEETALLLLDYLQENYVRALTTRYKLTGELPSGTAELLLLIGKKRGFLIKGGAVDTDKTARTVINEFRAGLLGRITLELPGEI